MNLATNLNMPPKKRDGQKCVNGRMTKTMFYKNWCQMNSSKGFLSHYTYLFLILWSKWTVVPDFWYFLVRMKRSGLKLVPLLVFLYKFSVVSSILHSHYYFMKRSPTKISWNFRDGIWQWFSYFLSYLIGKRLTSCNILSETYWQIGKKSTNL